MISPYFEKYGFKNYLNYSEFVNPKLSIIVTIPIYNEKEVTRSLQSLERCDVPQGDVIVLCVINSSEDDSLEIKERNRQTYLECLQWKNENSESKFTYLFLQAGDLPQKHAGVGLARKIAMDEASLLFEFNGVTEGIISCFDADSLCDKNYLVALEKHFKTHPKTPGCSIRYEHPISGKEFSDEIYQGIISYETHLRYYNLALKMTGYPGAFHTIGSSMAVRWQDYQKQGGMNKKKAGEDFYFLHKIISLGNFTELNSTRVIPSPRISDRVPFGTGKSIGKWIEGDASIHESYNLQGFLDLRETFNALSFLYEDTMKWDGLKKTIQEFILEEEWNQKMLEIRKNSTSFDSFKNRFFVWFNAFKILKFIHFARDNFYPNEGLSLCVSRLLNQQDVLDLPLSDLLIILREIEYQED